MTCTGLMSSPQAASGQSRIQQPCSCLSPLTVGVGALIMQILLNVCVFTADTSIMHSSAISCRSLQSSVLKVLPAYNRVWTPEPSLSIRLQCFLMRKEAQLELLGRR